MRNGITCEPFAWNMAELAERLAKISRRALTLAAVLTGSTLAGFSIGVLQHYVSFGIWGDGFSEGPFWLACFEGGFVGAVLAVPTGLIAYYGVLKGKVTVRRAMKIVLGSLVGGCLAGAVLFWPSAFATPVLTILLSLKAAERTCVADLTPITRGIPPTAPSL
jgi:hypothetical protein